MTPVRQCVKHIIDMAVTGLTLEELDGMQRRIDIYLNGVAEKDRNAAEETLLRTLKQASAEMTMPEAASALLDHAVMHVEQRISKRSL